EPRSEVGRVHPGIGQDAARWRVDAHAGVSGTRDLHAPKLSTRAEPQAQVAYPAPMRRWLVLALVPTVLFVAHMVGLAVLVLPLSGTPETVAYSVLYALEIAVVATVAVRLGRSRPMSRGLTAVLPLGMAAGLSLWLIVPALDLIRDTRATVDGVVDPEVLVARHITATLTALAVWALGIALLGQPVARLA